MAASGAVVAATLRANKDNSNDGGAAFLSSFQSFNLSHHQLLVMESAKIEKKKQQEAAKAEEKLDEWLHMTADGSNKRNWVLDELSKRCKINAQRKRHYRNLLGFMCFTVLFGAVLRVQRRPGENFEMASVMLKILPEQPNGELVQPMESWAQVHQAIATQILNIYVDPQCGDGICDMPHEFPAWGNPNHRYGCEADCGEDGNVTSLVLHLDYTQPVQGLLSEKLAQRAEGFQESSEPIKWNLCSREYLGICWYKDIQVINPGDKLTLNVHLPDDEWILRMGGDSRYLRGYMTTENDPEEACKTDCTTSDNCVFTCKRPRGMDLTYLDPPSTQTDSMQSSNATVPANVTMTSATQTDHLLAFEMCGFSPGPEKDRTMQNFYVPRNLTGMNAPDRVDELAVVGWDFDTNLQATLSAVYSTSAPTSFTTSDSLAQRLNQAPPPMNEVNTSATEGPTEGPTYEGGSSGDTPSPTTGNFNTAAPTQELTPTPSAPSSASSGTLAVSSSPTTIDRALLSWPQSKSEHQWQTGSRSLLQSGTDSVSDDQSSSCTVAPIELALNDPDISGTTANVLETHSPACGATTPVVRYSYQLPPWHTLSVRQSSSSYASVAELRAGGDCPGARSVACHNDSDVGTLTYTNTLRTAENVFYNQGGYNGATGLYELTWNVSLPSVASGSLWELVTCDAEIMGQSGMMTVALSEGVEDLTLSCTSQLSPTSMFAFTVPSGYKLTVSVDLPASGPAAHAHELRHGQSCPGSQYIACTDFGLDLNNNTLSNGNEISWMNFEVSEATVYYHIQDVSGTDGSNDLANVTLHWNIQEVGGTSCDTAIDMSKSTSPLSLSTLIGEDFLVPTCSRTSAATKDLILTHNVPPGNTITIIPLYSSYMSVHELRVGTTASCPGSALQCYDSTSKNRHVTFSNTGGDEVQVYYIQSGDNGAQGRFTIDWVMKATGLFKGCYRTAGDAQFIPGCMCDSSCATCGFSEYPNGQDQCITCPEGKALFVKRLDGTGYCGEPEEFVYPDLPLDQGHCASMNFFNLPSCEDFFSSQRCHQFKNTGLLALGGDTIPSHYNLFLAQQRCFCSGPLPIGNDGNRLQATDTIADACPEIFCKTYEECAALGTMRLEGGRFPWEGVLTLDVSVETSSGNNLNSASTVCSDGWDYNSAYVACRQLGYSGVLSYHLGTPKESSQGSRRFGDNKFPRGAAGVTYAGNARCTGSEKHLAQCLLDYGTYHPHQGNMPQCDEREVVNLQCWPGVEQYSSAACEVGRCCSAGCVPKSTDAYNGINDWPVYSMTKAPFLECMESEAGPSCNSVTPINGDGKCDAQCANAACFMDHWDCCPAGQVLDERSTGSTTECCQPVSVTDDFSVVGFKLNKFNLPATTLSTFRGISLNRVISGVMMHQTRSPMQTNGNRFNKLYDLVPSGGVDTTPYGMNPYLYSVSPMYHPNLNTSIYYRPDEVVTGRTVNGNNQTLYKAFMPYDVKGIGAGFPIIFSNTLNAQRTQELLDYMQYGHYYDQQTRDLTLQYILYNGKLDLFCIYRLHFHRSYGGSINWKYSVIPVDVNLYANAGDYVRLFFELVYLTCILLGAYSESSEMFEIKRLTGSYSEYFQSAWNYIDTVSIFMSLLSVVLWCVSAWYASAVFDIDLVYDVYTFPPHKWGRLLYNVSELDKLAEAFSQLHFLGSIQSTYVSISGANLFLFLLRIFKLLDFQPRMGILTRTISRAMGDLSHFFLLLLIVLVVYTIMGHIIFGPTIVLFSSMKYSLQTIINMLLGEFGDAQSMLLSHDVDYGVLTITAVLFFYSFMSIVFLVMLNFLLAIVVDAFADEKNHQESDDNTSMFFEVGSLLKRMVLSMGSSDFRANFSIDSIFNRVREMQQVSIGVGTPATEMDQEAPTRSRLAGYFGNFNKRRMKQLFTSKRVVQMKDERCKVTLDADLLLRVLSNNVTQEDDTTMDPKVLEILSLAIVNAFGEKQVGANTTPPVQAADADPVFLKLLQLQQIMELTSKTSHNNQLAIAQLTHDMDLLKQGVLSNKAPGPAESDKSTSYELERDATPGRGFGSGDGVHDAGAD